MREIKKSIKIGDKGEYVPGIAHILQGKVVDAVPHPNYKNMWKFEYLGNIWIASDYAFRESD